MASTDTGGNSKVLNLRGRRAIVTGAASGIGLSIATGLHDQGVKVALADLDFSHASEISGSWQEESMAVAVDVSSESSVRSMVDSVVQRWGSVDILINCAGVATPHIVATLPVADWRRVIDTNLTGPFLCSQAVLPHMKRQGSGRIVNVASIAAKRISYNGSAAYTAAKAGLVAFTRHLAYEVASEGINVNAICPGPTITPLMERNADPQTLLERTASIPLGRLTDPEDHMKAVLFLVSSLADAVCGVALDVDGGSLLGWYDVNTYMDKREQLTRKFDNR